MNGLTEWKTQQKLNVPESKSEIHTLRQGFLSSSKKMWVWNGKQRRVINAIPINNSDTFLISDILDKCHKLFQV